jgi:predicted patatin/cPLA2 family phospholipase
MNGAFFMAGQAAFGTTIYYENINNNNFIDFRRFWSKRSIVDLDYLVWDVMKGPKVLDCDAVLSSPIKLRALATSIDTGARTVFSEWAGADDLLGCLRAGATMPIVAGPPSVFRNGRYWDALLSEPIPATAAEEDGCTHLVVLLTRPYGTAGPRLSLSEQLYVVPRLRAVSPPLARRYAVRAQEYVRLLEQLRSGRGTAGRASVLAIAPSGPTVSKLERRRAHLVDGARSGMRAVLDVLGNGAYSIPEILTAFDRSGHRLSSMAGEDLPSHDRHDIRSPQRLRS